MRVEEYLDDLKELKETLPDAEGYIEVLERNDENELKSLLSLYRYSFKELECSVLGLCEILGVKVDD